jgi:hypothetical protein
MQNQRDSRQDRFFDGVSLVGQQKREQKREQPTRFGTPILTPISICILAIPEKNL